MSQLFSFLLILGLSIHAFTKEKTLTQQLKEKAAASAQKSPKEKRKIMLTAIEDLKKSQIMKTALKKGDQLPHFTLNDVKHGQVSSQQLLERGPIIIAFYRGGWCPYCNLQLRDLQKHLPKIKAHGAQLVAISPEAPDQTAITVKKQGLNFYVLSDINGKVSDSFGLTFKLPNDLITVYKGFGIDLARTNGNKKWELPLAATYIITKNGRIAYAYVDADYKKRAETKDLIKELSRLK